MKPAEIDASALRDMLQTVFAPWVMALDLQVLDAAGRLTGHSTTTYALL